MGFWLEKSETGYAELLMRLAQEDAVWEAAVDAVDEGQQDLFTTGHLVGDLGETYAEDHAS